MADCISCGRQLPVFSFGQRGDVCKDCRTSAIEVQGKPAWTTTQQTGSQPPTRRSRPPVTKVLVGLNAVVFIGMLVSGVSLTNPTTRQLLAWGANWGPLSLASQPWRILASNYLHIGIIHIALNMWCLWNLGYLAEQMFEPWTYFLTYTACGIAGSLASLWWHPLVVGAGASGAIFGLAGALISALYLGKLPIPRQAMQATMRSLLTFAGYNLFFGTVAAGIDNSAHIGGLVAGLALGSALAPHLMSPPDARDRRRLVVFTVAAVALFGGYTGLRQVNGKTVPQRFIPSLYLTLRHR